jgi:hypothetical protein
VHRIRYCVAAQRISIYVCPQWSWHFSQLVSSGAASRTGRRRGQRERQGKPGRHRPPAGSPLDLMTAVPQRAQALLKQPNPRQGLSKAASDRTNTAGSNMAGYRQIAPLSCCRTIYPTHPEELITPGKQVKAAANWSSRLPRAPVRHGQWRVAVVASQLEHVSITVV